MKNRKITIIVALLVLFCLLFLTGCAPASCIRPGNGVAYVFSNSREFSAKAKYHYSELESSPWDYYSVEYNITAFGIEYYYEGKKVPAYVPHYPNATKWHITKILTDVYDTNVKGTLAHSKGIYYIRETSGGITQEYLFDTLYDAFAFRISGNVFVYISEWLSEEELSFTNTWVCSNSVNSEEMSDCLEYVNHFYDKEILNMFEDHPNAFTSEGSKYVSQDFNTLKDELHGWFWLDEMDADLPIGFDWDITAGGIEIDFTKKDNPIINFSISAYFPEIDKSLRCGGELKYNNVNNVDLIIPDEVISTWQSYDGYNRVF